MPKIEYSPVALEKLGAIYQYIADDLQNPNAVAKTVSAIREKIRILKDLPNIGAPLTSRSAEIPELFKKTRVLLCGQYLALYQYDEKTIRILQIYHTAEDYIRHLFELRQQA